MAEHDVTLTGAAPVVLAALRERVDPGRPDVLSETFERLFATLSGRLTMAAVAPVGPAWNLYHRTRDAAMTVAAALPVAADAALPAGIERVELPATAAAWTVPMGGVDGIGSAYHTVRSWMEAARPAPFDGAREVSLIFDGAHDGRRTELQIVVRPSPAPVRL